MQTAISIIGGNIAGLSTAYHLARRGFRVTVYEARIWNKPCGGAISWEFVRYLTQALRIEPAWLSGRLLAPYRVRKLRKYPWFAPVHNSRQKT